MLKTLKQILFITALVAGISISASAQKEGDQKKPPPKEPPPTIVVKPEKKPKEEKPKGDKRPQAMILNGKYELSFV